MNLKLPIGFDFKQQQTTRQILDGQVMKFTKTWKGQRIYKYDYGIDWQSFDHQKSNDNVDAANRLTDFLIQQYAVSLPQIKVISVQFPNVTDPNSLNFYLVYNYKGMFKSKVYIQVNLDGQVDVQTNSGIL